MFRNVTYAFIDGLQQLVGKSEVVAPRGHETRELLSHKIVIQNPTERVYVTPNRYNNIFAAIAETIWVIGGRNDLEYLSRYLPRAADFSDDGLIWRAGYGPRLRNWHGVDQVTEVARILRENPDSRRAVLIIFDPAEDFVNSKDIPCNNWLHFIIRDNHLHLNVAIRSNDVIWGFSGINTFEWSVLQEMMAYWTGTKVGQLTIFVSSFHLYKRHYKRAKKIISQAHNKTLYDFGFSSATFSTLLSDIDNTLSSWFEIEEKIRNKEIGVEIEIERFKDDFLRNCLEMLYIYNKYLDNAQSDELAILVEQLPINDFKVAAIEYLSHRFSNRRLVQLHEEEAKYFQYFWNETQKPQSVSFEKIISLLKILHYKKTLVYKDSWKKHGEVIGIFANISRKFDRIESIIVDDARATTDETLLDTLADLAVYSAKYLTYLAENYKLMFRTFIAQYQDQSIEIETYYGNKGFDFMADALTKRYHETDKVSHLKELSECYQIIKQNFELLDDILIKGDWRTDDARKCSTSADLAITGVHAVLLIVENDPSQFSRFVKFIEDL